MLVLEAGTRQKDNINITVPARARFAWGTDIDWAYLTTPQRFAANRTLSLPRGKVLGGTSAINFMAWVRGFTSEYTAWTGLARSEAWSFEALLPFFKKCETFHAPGRTNLDGTIMRQYDPAVHGRSGPVNVSFTPFVSPQFAGLFDALEEAGVREARDLSAGADVGMSWTPQTVDPVAETRVTSDTAYSE